MYKDIDTKKLRTHVNLPQFLTHFTSQVTDHNSIEFECTFSGLLITLRWCWGNTCFGLDYTGAHSDTDIGVSSGVSVQYNCCHPGP